jgi:hypothetical protein
MLVLVGWYLIIPVRHHVPVSEDTPLWNGMLWIRLIPLMNANTPKSVIGKPLIGRWLISTTGYIHQPGRLCFRCGRATA